MDFMFGVDMSPRLTASILTIGMVLAGGMFVIRRRRRKCDCPEHNSLDVISTKKETILNTAAYLLVTDFASGRLDGNLHLLVDKLSKKQITDQDADKMMDVINKNNKMRKRKGTTKREEKEKESEKERDLKAAVQELEEENTRLKQSVSELQLKNDSWEEQIRILHVQLAAVSKYAGKLKHLLGASNCATQKVDSFSCSSKMFQSQIRTHYDNQKMNATLN